MQCVDCHNRAAHSFEVADRAVDGAILAGEIPADLPFIKKTGLALIQAAIHERRGRRGENRRGPERFLPREISGCLRQAIQRYQRGRLAPWPRSITATCFPI